MKKISQQCLADEWDQRWTSVTFSSPNPTHRCTQSVSISEWDEMIQQLTGIWHYNYVYAVHKTGDTDSRLEVDRECISYTVDSRQHTSCVSCSDSTRDRFKVIIHT